MADVRLIDANALKGKREWFDCHECGYECEIEFVKWDDIEKAPTIDAVPVVRCRECKYAEKTVWSSGEMYCRVWKMNPRPDGFCHLGAKMDAKDMNVPIKDGGADNGR